MQNSDSNSSQASDERIVVHEYVQKMDANFSAYQYCVRGEAPRTINSRPQPWYFSGRAFLVYTHQTPENESGNRVPLYHALLENDSGSRDVVLAATDGVFSQNPKLSRAKGNDGQDLPALGFVLDAPMVGANTEKLYQLWEPQTSNPAIFAYGTNSYRSGLEVSPDFFGGPVYAPRTLDYEFIPNPDPNSSLAFALRDRATNVQMVDDNISVPYGDWRIRLFAPTGWCFSTFSFARFGSHDIRGFDGRFFVDSWSPQMISIIDSNLLVGGLPLEYSFNLTMHNGRDFKNLDPKFINRSKSGQL